MGEEVLEHMPLFEDFYNTFNKLDDNLTIDDVECLIPFVQTAYYQAKQDFVYLKRNNYKVLYIHKFSKIS